jgi:site-specific recombinase XerD
MHSLLHSYTTWLHKQLVDIKLLKELLGHNSLRTTEIYTHVSKKDISKIPRPLDNFKL